MKINSVVISGLILKDPQYVFERNSMYCYKTELAVKRDSGIEDIIPVVLSENLLPMALEGTMASVTGEYRSYAKDGRLNHYVLAHSVTTLTNGNSNNIDLIASVIAKPTKRITPQGRRIADLFLAYSRYGRSDYIPAVIWGKGAEEASHLKIGTKVHITGRIQSREYCKNEVTRRINEISIKHMLVVEIPT